MGARDTLTGYFLFPISTSQDPESIKLLFTTGWVTPFTRCSGPVRSTIASPTAPPNVWPYDAALISPTMTPTNENILSLLRLPEFLNHKITNESHYRCATAPQHDTSRAPDPILGLVPDASASLSIHPSLTEATVSILGI